MPMGERRTSLIYAATLDDGAYTLSIPGELASGIEHGQAMGNGQQYAQWIANPIQWRATSACDAGCCDQ
ncbi:hypothetical protein [Paraburkholderia caballeronis]|uniref:hypothetical protein n=1 Tax=Paraburkholderia caballeronis TaxID=416943 RepID=UPI00106490A9|nr:hypothetical protein [Paraburkholderia caballeronis]